jgi:hypothetical protein
MHKPSNGPGCSPQALQADELHKTASRSDLGLELLQLPSGLRSHPGEESDVPATPTTQSQFNIHPLQQAIHQPPLLTTEGASVTDPCVVSAMSQGSISCTFLMMLSFCNVSFLQQQQIGLIRRYQVHSWDSTPVIFWVNL